MRKNPIMAEILDQTIAAWLLSDDDDTFGADPGLQMLDDPDVLPPMPALEKMGALAKRLCQVLDAPRLHAWRSVMIRQVSQTRLKGFWFPRSINYYAVWAYHRFAPSLRHVKDLVAERGAIVSYDSIRVWCHRFGTQLAARIRLD